MTWNRRGTFPRRRGDSRSGANASLKEVALSVAVSKCATGYFPDLFGITSQSSFLDLETRHSLQCVNEADSMMVIGVLFLDRTAFETNTAIKKIARLRDHQGGEVVTESSQVARA